MKKIFRTALTCLSIYILLLMLSSCVNSYKHVEFNDGSKNIIIGIREKYQYDTIEFRVEKNPQTFTLSILLVNGKELPTQTDELNSEAINVGRKIKQILKNPMEYSLFKILYVTRSSNYFTIVDKYNGFEIESSSL